MDGKVTDNSGSFSIDGTSSQLLGKISPVLKIYHKCNTGALT
uniref:Transthyretin n=1 Tax=Romanomermis culicivorax TaxID=13658 RepID=A0A915HFA4_ROMCU